MAMTGFLIEATQQILSLEHPKAYPIIRIRNNIITQHIIP